MKKYQCKECDKNCIVYRDGGKSPTCCIDCYDCVDWYEVKEEEKLPKLTAEVFDRPDCPKWAKYAFVNEDGFCYWYEENPGLFYTGRGHGSKVKLIGCFNDCINTLIERPAKNLPDWCKVGEWVYYKPLKKYCLITEIDDCFVHIETLDNKNRHSNKKENFIKYVLQARKRPFNTEEMKALVGKVIEHGHSREIVIACRRFTSNEWKIEVIDQYFSAEDLLKYNYTIDNAPCGVLEHLENGEWVE